MGEATPPGAKQNAKISDADIQGDKAGKRNRASTDAGVMPPPAGETPAQGRDPRASAKPGATPRS